MISTLISFDGRGARRSALLLVAVVSLAGCNDHSPIAQVGPTTASMAQGTNGFGNARARQSWSEADTFLVGRLADGF